MPRNYTLADRFKLIDNYPDVLHYTCNKVATVSTVTSVLGHLRGMGEQEGYQSLTLNLKSGPNPKRIHYWPNIPIFWLKIRWKMPTFSMLSSHSKPQKWEITQTNNCFTAPLDFVRDYTGKLAPEATG